MDCWNGICRIPRMRRKDLQFGVPRGQRHWGCVICCVTAGTESLVKAWKLRDMTAVLGKLPPLKQGFSLLTLGKAFLPAGGLWIGVGVLWSLHPLLH